MKIMLDTNVLISALVFGGKTRNVLLTLVGTNHKIYVSDYVMKEFSEKMYLKWPNKADKLLEVVHKMPFYFCESNVNNLTQATTTYSVSFNWHGIPCAFLYL